MEITVVNKMFSESTTIHWHGIHMPGTQYMDGARDVTQAPILPGACVVVCCCSRARPARSTTLTCK